MGLCLLELFNGTWFNGARTVLMGLTLLQMFNGALSASHTRSILLLKKMNHHTAVGFIGAILSALMGLCLLDY